VNASEEASSAAIDASIPMDVMDMFKEAQQRILDLNQSRMHALEELAEARAKIIELEERLAQAERDAMANVHMLAEAVVQERGARGGEMELEEAAVAVELEAAEEGPLDEEEGDVGSAGTGTISILYETSWSPAYIHFVCPNGSWTEAPGMPMREGEMAHNKIFSITAPSIEFVLNDGGEQWDKPTYDANYFIGSPGSYIINQGKIQKVK